MTYSSRFTLLLAGLVFWPLCGFAGDLKPRAEVNVRAGTERSILMTEFWAPLAQQSDRVLYGDLRLMGDDGDNREGNLGFGYRQISKKTNSVLGGNIWIDRRRTENGNNFHQLTLGVESLGDTIDLRANGYIQLNSSKNVVTPNLGNIGPYLANNGIYYDTNGLIVEEPQHGMDAEIGYRLPVLQKYVDATRVYAGGYHFWGDQTDNVTGFRLRGEAQVNSIFSVGARFQHDGPRGSQGFLEATLRFPFKSKKLYQEHGLRSRLDESPERDIDIVTGAKVVDTGLMKSVLNASGTEQRIVYVDNTNANAGDGSKDNPYNTLKAAEAALRDNDILYINRGDGTTAGMDQGLVIGKNNVQLIGSGSALAYNGFTLLESGLAPMLTNLNTPASSSDIYVGNGVLITGDNAYLSGVTVSGAAFVGIRALADGTVMNSIVVDNVSSIGNGSTGIVAHALNSGTIANVQFTNNRSMSNMTIVSAVATGIAITSATGSTVGTAIIENNIVSNNGSSGITGSANASIIQEMRVRNNEVTTSVGGGISISASNIGLIDTILVENNTSNGNGQTGINIQSQTGSMLNKVSVLNNVVLNSGQRGIEIRTQNPSSVIALAEVSKNVVANSRHHGVWIITTLDSSMSASVSNNMITGNGSGSTPTTKYYGIAVDNDSTGAVTVDLGGGVLGSVGNNRVYDNSYQDVFIDSMPGTGATTGAVISAKNNWWGVGTGLAVGRRTLDGTSQIDTTDHLTTDPQH